MTQQRPASTITRSQQAGTLKVVNDFFERHADPNYIKKKKLAHVVFLGDVFECWLTPLDEECPTMEQQLTDENEKYGVAFPGEDVNYLEDQIGFPSKDNPLVKMEHGHLNDLFNRPDPYGRPTYGEYITRLLRRSWIGRFLSGKYMHSIKSVILGDCKFDKETPDDKLKQIIFKGQREVKNQDGTSGSTPLMPDENMYDIINRYATLPGDFHTKGSLSEDYIKELLIG
ncbi:unnamed protein product [Vitrella brassicaformis CCMP3155]|uniref:Uncharacterized protein n=1 Tax=Vitrella brassicaformis (strain CCMP3155) TaxID=1169540 RepID=A0A0G4F8K5_VITBC|nr:unnamed protein product [Vitrella brassicaformis CCMP3155]|eukprot:CEM09072.1 unnamed protein product [Vitrella brassicaformis CCMP3155]